MPSFSLDDRKHVSLCEVVDRVLNKGAIISGQVFISVADVELIRLGLDLLIASTETRLDVANASEVPEQTSAK